MKQLFEVDDGEEQRENVNGKTDSRLRATEGHMKGKEKERGTAIDSPAIGLDE